jgi:hypothetical protein
MSSISQQWQHDRMGWFRPSPAKRADPHLHIAVLRTGKSRRAPAKEDGFQQSSASGHASPGAVAPAGSGNRTEVEERKAQVEEERESGAGPGGGGRPRADVATEDVRFLPSRPCAAHSCWCKFGTEGGTNTTVLFSSEGVRTKEPFGGLHLLPLLLLSPLLPLLLLQLALLLLLLRSRK